MADKSLLLFAVAARCGLTFLLVSFRRRRNIVTTASELIDFDDEIDLLVESPDVFDVFFGYKLFLVCRARYFTN